MNSYRNVYGFDTETDNDGHQAWITQWALSDGTKEQVGRDLRSVVTMMEDLCTKHDHCYVYIHNLNYDWEFIKYAVFKFCEEQDYALDLNRKNGAMITATVRPKDKKDRREHDLFAGKLQFRDSMKKRPGSLASLAKSIGMEKLEGVSDFHPGWSEECDFEDPSNWDYVRMDARIVAVAMRKAHKGGYDASTASGDSWKHAKQFVAQGKKYKKNLQWDTWFPHIPLSLDRQLRPAYFGGINVSQHNGELFAVPGLPISHDDVCSMYPSVMSFDPLPIGHPIRMEVPPQSDSGLWIMACRIRLNVKEGRIPWFTWKNAVDALMEGQKCGEPVMSSYGWHEMVLTNVDLLNLSRFYDIEFDEEYNNVYWYFKSKTGIFRPYIEELIKRKDECKRNGDIDGKNQAKILMNSLYGRFCLNPEGEETEMYKSEETGDLEYRTELTTSEDMDAYLPFGLFVTAWARMRLLDHCDAVGNENVIHCDTDSVIHYGGKIYGEEYDNGLGTWEVESRPVRMFEGGFKRYIEFYHEPVRSLDDLSVTCAGVPQKTKEFVRADGTVGRVPVGMWVELLDDPQIIATKSLLGHEEYEIGSVWLRNLYHEAGLDPDRVNTMKLIPRRVPGGVILEERQHQLSDNMFKRLYR